MNAMTGPDPPFTRPAASVPAAARPYKDPYAVLRYSEALGNGSREYELIDVLPVKAPERIQHTYQAVAAL